MEVEDDQRIEEDKPESGPRAEKSEVNLGDSDPGVNQFAFESQIEKPDPSLVFESQIEVRKRKKLKNSV